MYADKRETFFRVLATCTAIVLFMVEEKNWLFAIFPGFFPVRFFQSVR